MIQQYIQGDLVASIDAFAAGKIDRFVMAQGCNCFCTQGSGIAGQLRKYPEVLATDIASGRKGDKDKLGKVSIASIVSEHSDYCVAVVNMYTQYEFGQDKMNVDYRAIGDAFEHVNNLMQIINPQNRVLFIPKIGAGLAGGDWDTIAKIIDESTPNLDVVVVDYVPGVDAVGSYRASAESR